MNTWTKIGSAALVMVGAAMTPANAARPDPELVKLVAAVEARSGITTCVLQALVMTESAYSPWEINNQGPDIHSSSQAEAASKAVPLIGNRRKIDVGIAQRNVYYHYLDEHFRPMSYEELYALMDPVANIQWAADYYKQLLRGVHGDEVRAIGRYHRFVMDGEFWKYVSMVQANLLRCARNKGVDISNFKIPETFDGRPPPPGMREDMQAITYALQNADDETAAAWSEARRTGKLDGFIAAVRNSPEFKAAQKHVQDKGNQQQAVDFAKTLMADPGFQAAQQRTHAGGPMVPPPPPGQRIDCPAGTPRMPWCR